MPISKTKNILKELCTAQIVTILPPNDTAPFTVRCNEGVGDCANYKVKCPTSAMCSVYCENVEACQSMTVECPLFAECYVYCNGTSACRYATINWKNQPDSLYCGPYELKGRIITTGKPFSLCNVNATLSPASLLTA